MGPIQTLEDLIGLLRRRFWLMALITVIGGAIAAVYAKSRPDIYESAAVLQVEMPTVVDGSDAAAPVNVMQALQTIEQRLTTRDAIIAMIERHGLFADTPQMSLEDKIAAMRAAVRFESVTGRSGQLSALIIVAQASRADDAARIANDLAQSVLDMGAEDKRATTEASFAFFKEQEGRLLGQITRLETEIAAYRDANRSALPGVQEAQQDEIARLDVTLGGLDQEVAALQSESMQLRGLQPQRATDRRRLDDIRQRLDVLEAQRAPLVERKAALEANIGTVAEVDRALSAYERQLGLLQAQYAANSARMAEAETAQSLAARSQTERFSLLERAISPEYPKSARGRKLAIAGVIGSAALALLLAFVLDLLKPVLRTSGQMERELGLRPVVAIPVVPTRKRKS
ncbi:MAG: hypothetical protein JXR75_01720 [Rhodobacteraceae bacterium]|nr:hypothetical protein [Paracoccaceae bacterium]